MTELEALLRLVLATGSGALLGLEREDRDKPAGIRTFSIVALGSALFSVVSIMTFGVDDAGDRIPAQIVTGVGFLGAGTIIQQRGNVVGLTTAAGIWAAAAVGMGFAFGLYILSAGAVVIMLAVLRIVGRLEGAFGGQTGASPGRRGPAGSEDGSEPASTTTGQPTVDDDERETGR